MERFYLVIMVRDGAILGVQTATSGKLADLEAFEHMLHNEENLTRVFFDSRAYPDPPRDGLWFTLGEFGPDPDYGMRVVPMVDRDASGMRRDFSEAPWARPAPNHLTYLADGMVEPGIAAWLKGQPKQQQCDNFAPAWFTGRWRDWHRGHGCDKDDGRPRTPEGQAEIDLAERTRRGE